MIEGSHLRPLPFIAHHPSRFLPSWLCPSSCGMQGRTPYLAHPRFTFLCQTRGVGGEEGQPFEWWVGLRPPSREGVLTGSGTRLEATQHVPNISPYFLLSLTGEFLG